MKLEDFGAIAKSLYFARKSRKKKKQKLRPHENVIYTEIVRRDDLGSSFKRWMLADDENHSTDSIHVRTGTSVESLRDTERLVA